MDINLGNSIRILRSKNSVTQEELADALGVCRTTVQAWEMGKKQPRGKNIQKMVSYFSLTREETSRYFKKIEEETEDSSSKECENPSQTPLIITTVTQMEIAINQVSYIQEQNIRPFDLTEITPIFYSVQAIASPSPFPSQQQLMSIDERARSHCVPASFGFSAESKLIRRMIRKKFFLTMLLSFLGSAIFLLLSNFFIWLYLNETTYYEDGYHYILSRVTKMNLTGINILGLIFICCVVCIASCIHFFIIRKKLKKGKDQ